MKTRSAIYVVGIPLAVIWLFVQVTGWTFILWGIVFLGCAMMLGIIFTMVRSSTTTPYQQYVRTHNAIAEVERAKEAKKNRVAPADESED